MTEAQRASALMLAADLLAEDYPKLASNLKTIHADWVAKTNMLDIMALELTTRETLNEQDMQRLKKWLATALKNRG